MADVPHKLPPKKEVALALLESSSVFVHLDPRREGVIVPRWFAGQPQLVLQIGLNLVVPIPDLTVDDEGVSCTLSFSRTPFWCKLPWSAVYALVDENHRGMVWPNDVPPEVAAQAQQAQQREAKGEARGEAREKSAEPAEKPGKKPRTKLAAVKDSPRDAQRPTARSRSKQARAAAAAETPPTSPEQAAAPPPEKKPVPIRPRLAAAPSKAPPEEPAASHPAHGAGQTPEAADDSTKGGRAAAARPSDKKPKRELPPYLRVIK